MKASYGGAWQELRALIATWFFTLASAAHFQATLDLSREVTRLADEAKRRG